MDKNSSPEWIMVQNITYPGQWLISNLMVEERGNSIDDFGCTKKKPEKFKQNISMGVPKSDIKK